jgi:hypothetical protein
MSYGFQTRGREHPLSGGDLFAVFVSYRPDAPETGNFAHRRQSDPKARIAT